jgi:hypothetical protein
MAALMTPDLLVQHMDEFQLANPHGRTVAPRLRLGLGCSLYMRDPQSPRMRQALAACADHYLALAGDHIKAGYDSIRNTPVRAYRPGDVHFSQALAAGDDVRSHSFGGEFYGDADPYVASHFGLAFSATSAQEHPLADRPAFFRATLPLGWIQARGGLPAYRELVQHWCSLLRPFHGHAGYAALPSLSLVEYRRSAWLATPVLQRYPGLDLDLASSVASMTRRAGPPLRIKGVNWLTALDEGSLELLGGRTALLDGLGPAFNVTDYPGGILVQAGAQPALGDADAGDMPEAYRELSRRLQPLRLRYPDGWSLLQSPDPVACDHTPLTNAWLARWD